MTLPSAQLEDPIKALSERRQCTTEHVFSLLVDDPYVANMLYKMYTNSGYLPLYIKTKAEKIYSSALR